MKILCLADEEDPAYWEYLRRDKLRDIDLMISCGDLKAEYLSYLVTLGRAPLLYVHGNHDESYAVNPPEGCDCIDGRLVTVKGLRIAGLGGCVRYRPGSFQYTQTQMKQRVWRMHWKLRRGVDIVVAHAPVKGFGDMPNVTHEGFSAFEHLIRTYHPKFLLHGHVHQRYGYQQQREYELEGTRIINVGSSYILEI